MVERIRARHGWGYRAPAQVSARHPVYAIGFNAQLAERYGIYPLSETYDLWEVRRPYE
jgi:hypothetical protein